MIRFPQQHIADSVAARIMEVAKKMNPVEAQGARIDAALQQPIGDVEAPANIEDALVGRALDL